MKNAANIVKWLVILVIAIFLFFLFRRCGHVNVKPAKNDTVIVKIDSIVYRYKDSIVYVPKPYKVTETKEVPIYIESEPTAQYLPIDSFPPAIRRTLQNYININYYKDSLITQHGNIYVYDTTQYNKIQGQKIVADLRIVEKEKIITLNAPRRTVGFMGLEALGNQSTPFYAVGGSFGLMFRNQKYYGIGALLDKNGNVWYSGRIMLPLRLHK